MEPAADAGGLVQLGVMIEGDPLLRGRVEQEDAVGDVENQHRGRGRSADAPPQGAEPAHVDDQQDAAAAAAAAAAVAAAEADEQALRRQVDEWIEKNQFGMLWEAVTVINIVLCYKKPDTGQMAVHKAFHALYFGFSILKGLALGYFGASPAILLNRMIGLSLSRQLLWFFWCFACYAIEMNFNWETHVRTYCTEPRYPLLCFPLAVLPFSLCTFSVGYDAISMCLFPLRAYHNFMDAKVHGAVHDQRAVRSLATRLVLHMASAVALYCYCLRVVRVHGATSATMANHTLRTIRGVGRGIEWLVLAALFFYFTIASALRAMRVAIVFVRRRRWGWLWRGRYPHPHLE